MNSLAEKLWILTGRVGYLIARYPIGLLVRDSKRTRVLVVCNDEYLVVTHWLGDGRWMLPGGGLHHGEDPLLAAQRETKEEIGLTLPAENFVHAGHFKCKDGVFQFNYDLYVIALPEKPLLKLQTIEIQSAKWFNRTEALSGNSCPELAVALQHWP